MGDRTSYPLWHLVAISAALAAGCGDDQTAPSPGSTTGGSGGLSGQPDGGTQSDASTGGSGGASGGSAGSGGASGGAGGSAGSAGAGATGGTGGGTTGGFCDPLPAPSGSVVHVDPTMTAQLQGLVSSASANDTFVFAAGTYNLSGAYLWITATGVTLRSASGNPGDVVLDGNYETTEVITVVASDVTIAELTIRRAKTHPIHVTAGDDGDTLNTRIYRVHMEDPGEQAIKINPNAAKTHFTDNGEVACSRMVLTDVGRPHVNPTAGGCYTGGVDAHGSRGWVIRDNHIEGFWCANGLSEHAVHFWRGGRDTIVERNVLVNNARGVGFGLASSGDARQYGDAPCPAAGSGYIDHYGGIVRNNFIVATRSELFASSAGFDTGIGFWSACNAQALHNTILSTGDLFSAVEWRFASSIGVAITNNLTSHALRERDGASATETGNLTSATAAMFSDVAAADLHLVASATDAIDQGAPVGAGLCDQDIDGDSRDDQRDVGADEVQQ